MAQSCDQSTLCLQTTAEPNPAQIFPRQRKGLPFGAAELAPGSRLCHQQHINLQASHAAALSLSLPLAELGSQGRAGSRGLPAFGMAGWPEREGTRPGGKAGRLNLGCENPASHA